jgi:DNA-directed RNA polymerase specialized sigma24 family protein
VRSMDVSTEGLPRARRSYPLTQDLRASASGSARGTGRTSRAGYVVNQDVVREDAKLTPDTFARLLAWLDDGVESNGERYLEVRRRLASYFDRRNRPAADDLADKTLTRVAITLAQDGAIVTRPPARYCFAVAKYVLLEDLRRDRRLVPFDDSRATDTTSIASHGAAAAERDARERRLDCLDHCLQNLKPEQRELIIEYYGESRQMKIQRRRALAVRLGISMNALAIRAWRIREGLMACVGQCRDHQ